MSKHVFTYGSLMFSQVWQRVVSGHYASSAATLADHARFALRDETYPGMIAMAGREVGGIVYRDVAAADLSALDAFEGSQYRRCSVEVVCEDGEKILAETYLFLAHERLSEQPWDPAVFAIGRFMHAYCPNTDGR